ncbi:MAG TPA: class I SAM-dependent methyltransferase, partial [Candidatus Baltobacteraceae bacterium]|nr:class I SAM-dependent methyltransferase [Candidatus Baltobacteraceae bacterium]
MKRAVKPELLDELPPENPRAVHSRRDLQRINWWMRNHGIMTNALKENYSGTPKQIVEIGAGDGNFLLGVAKRTNWKNVNAILLDQQKIISPETFSAFSKINWRAETIVADIFDWDETAREDARPTDIVIANLFLHHFEDLKLKQLLQKISKRAKLFIAVETHRFAFPFLCAQLLRFIGCNKVTLHDAEASIRAGFVRG